MINGTDLTKFKFSGMDKVEDTGFGRNNSSSAISCEEMILAMQFTYYYVQFDVKHD